MATMTQADRQSPHMVDQEAVPMPQETFQFGNTTVTVRSKSDVIHMTPEQITEWFRGRIDAKDPVALAIVDVASQILTQPRSSLGS